jgi:hypothetical protein
MSTANPAAAAPDTPFAPAKEIARPLLWLLAILILGLGLRVLHFRGAAFQTDEFSTLAAVAERPGLDPGTTPTAQDPLVPVPSLGEVSNRSVIPFGIPDPLPLYHYVLWAVLHVLPVADWSVRLPSLLAAVACIAAVFFLVRRPFGNEMALVAALFVALDPIQINTSWLARPFALADLFTVLSFAALLGLLRARTPAAAAPWVLGYAACVALIGYLSPLTLCVVLAHLVMVPFAARYDETARKAARYWVAGLALALLLLAPEFAYFYRVSSWAWAHTRYLTAVNEVHIWTSLGTLVLHNLALIGGLVLVLAAGAVVRMQLQGGSAPEAEGEGGTPAADAPADGGAPAAITAQAPPAGTAVAPAPAAAAAPPEPAAPLPESDEGLNMARAWVFVPQAALLLISLLVASVFVSRNLTYTTLGAAVLLAYYATRDGSREVRLGVAGTVALGLLLLGFWPAWSSGHGLFSNDKAQVVMGVPGTDKGMAGTEVAKVYKDGDVVLMRAGHIEADFLGSPADLPEATRPQVERVVLAPLTLLYPDSQHRTVIPLTFSQYRNQSVRTPAGDQAPLEGYYTPALADRLKDYRRFWMTGVGPGVTPNSWRYLACVVPWMATALDRGDLVLARNREGDERYITVKPNLGLDEAVPGLVPKPGQAVEDLRADDFKHILHIVKPKEEKKEEKK